jgi:hypothetical protein
MVSPDFPPDFPISPDFFTLNANAWLRDQFLGLLHILQTLRSAA